MFIVLGNKKRCLNTSFKQGYIRLSLVQTLKYSIGLGLLHENYIKDVLLCIQTISKFINNHRIVYKAGKYIHTNVLFIFFWKYIHL